MEHQLRPVEGWGAPQALETGGFVERSCRFWMCPTCGVLFGSISLKRNPTDMRCT